MFCSITEFLEKLFGKCKGIDPEVISAATSERIFGEISELSSEKFLILPEESPDFFSREISKQMPTSKSLCKENSSKTACFKGGFQEKSHKNF